MESHLSIEIEQIEMVSSNHSSSSDIILYTFEFIHDLDNLNLEWWLGKQVFANDTVGTRYPHMLFHFKTDEKKPQK